MPQQKNKDHRPAVLTIAASDSAGMAGIAQDIRSQTAMGCHSLTVITANTAQNNQQFIAMNPCASSVIDTQLKALAFHKIDAVKIGLIAGVEQCESIGQWLSNNKTAVVFDPVLFASSETHTANHREKNDLIISIKQNMIPYCDLLTPNVLEAEQLSGITINDHHDMIRAAKALIDLGVKAVLLKGGHLSGNWSQDLFLDSRHSFWLSSPRIESQNSRGTGCALSSVIASALALGYPIKDAIIIGKMAINQALRNGYAVADSFGPVNVQQFPDRQIDLPLLTRTPDLSQQAPSFLSCNAPLGLYPVVDRADWIERLAVLGVSTVQIRIKDLDAEALDQEISKAVTISERYSVCLFVNDYWQLAIKHKAYGVHLGQEDLEVADIKAIRNTGLRLGISTHCHYEVARAHAIKPSYIACGPIFETRSKEMPWIPQSVNGLNYWRQCLDYPLVAIGGINQSNIDAVVATGADGIAMISAITQAENPEAVTRDFLQRLKSARLLF